MTTDPTPRWYELDWLSPFTDLMMLAGFVGVIVGVYLIFVPAAFIVGGSGICFLAWHMAKSAA